MALQTNTSVASDQLIHRFSERIKLPDGASTTVNFVSYNRSKTKANLVSFVQAVHLLDWCAENGFTEAMGGGFFLRKSNKLLGQTYINGRRLLGAKPFPRPWHDKRGSVHMPLDGLLEIAPRDELPKRITGDLLQAGPTLINHSQSAFMNSPDPEGFSQTAYLHDEDINAKRHPRAAIGVSEDRIWTITADGRSSTDAGLFLHELAEIMLQLHITNAVNLDGGSSSTHISEGRLINRPRTNEQESEIGFPIHSALVFNVGS